MLPSRWFPCRLLEVQRQFLFSETRFNLVAAGRRSFKTEGAKRRLVRKALSQVHSQPSRFIASAPVHAQARRVFWKDLLALTPPFAILGKPRESTATIELVNGNEIVVMGLDVPERIEGSPIGHILVDEAPNVKQKAWDEHISPALSDTQGTADIIGVPEGRNHFYHWSLEAKSRPDWSMFTWTSEDALPMYLGEEVAAAEIRSAKDRMDERTYRQEFLADFVTFSGRVYYNFNEGNIQEIEYNPRLPLIFMFDFNVSPGVAAVGQDYGEFLAVIDEVWIPRDSNTPLVCKTLHNRWKHHTGHVYVYGDATGGARKTSAVEGSDWDLVKRYLPMNLTFRVPKANPLEKVRVNATTSRICSSSNNRHFMVSPRCIHVIEDFEGVTVNAAGEIDKTQKNLTHISDAIGYYFAVEFPLHQQETEVEQI